jgi:hypothetical protein
MPTQRRVPCGRGADVPLLRSSDAHSLLHCRLAPARLIRLRPWKDRDPPFARCIADPAFPVPAGAVQHCAFAVQRPPRASARRETGKA